MGRNDSVLTALSVLAVFAGCLLLTGSENDLGHIRVAARRVSEAPPRRIALEDAVPLSSIPFRDDEVEAASVLPPTVIGGQVQWDNGEPLVGASIVTLPATLDPTACSEAVASKEFNALDEEARFQLEVESGTKHHLVVRSPDGTAEYLVENVPAGIRRLVIRFPLTAPPKPAEFPDTGVLTLDNYRGATNLSFRVAGQASATQIIASRIQLSGISSKVLESLHSQRPTLTQWKELIPQIRVLQGDGSFTIGLPTTAAQWEAAAGGSTTEYNYPPPTEQAQLTTALSGALTQLVFTTSVATEVASGAAAPSDSPPPEPQPPETVTSSLTPTVQFRARRTQLFQLQTLLRQTALAPQPHSTPPTTPEPESIDPTPAPQPAPPPPPQCLNLLAWDEDSPKQFYIWNLKPAETP